MDPNSIISNLNRAYDNAIVLREEIGSEVLAYIQLAIYDIQTACRSKDMLMGLQEVLDHILAFWGIADDMIESEQVRNIIKTGKRVERLDLYARLGMPAAHTDPGSGSYAFPPGTKRYGLQQSICGGSDPACQRGEN